MGRIKQSEPDDKEQFARFVEKAKEIQRDDAKEVFEEAFTKIAKSKRAVKTKDH